MGVRGGQAVLSEVARVSRNTEIYIVNTHFHPEHATGEAGFPQTAKVIRAAAQQQDIEEMGMKWVQNFASRSPVIAEVLQGITAFRTVQVRTEFAKKYPDWAQPLRVHAAATVIYAELQ
jgi:glyoxylase-like metal-dependent hydrolase (beta-lactamase superfamily II)